MRYYKELNTIVLYIEDNIKGKISYDSLADAVGFSVAHVREIFNVSFKKPLAKYILERKISHIAYELTQNNKRLINIAFEYGFENYEVFERAFKRVTGLAPSKFRKNLCDVGIAHISSGIYAPIIKNKKEVIKMFSNNLFRDCVLSGIPAVNFGGGVRSTFPACLQTCLEYLGQCADYDYLMVASGAAFRLRWNIERIDDGNVDIMNIFDDKCKPFDLCLKAVGRSYNIINGKNITKDDFSKFIMNEVQKGKPCIALGIVGPPEACLITGYRGSGEKLLGYSLFQNDPPFCANTVNEESGYFVCSDWWENCENNDIKMALSVGDYNDSNINTHSIIELALEVMNDESVKQYASGQNAYKEIVKFLSDNSKWSDSTIASQLFEQVVVYGDTMVMLCNRASASNFFANISTENNQAKKVFEEISKKYKQIAELPDNMCKVPPMGWNMSKEMVECICKSDIREKIISYFLKAKDLEKQIIRGSLKSPKAA